MLLFLTACKTLSDKPQEPLVVKVTVPTLPPPELLRECPVPSMDVIKTNQDLVVWAKQTKDELLLCNLDKKVLRDWSKKIEENYK